MTEGHSMKLHHEKICLLGLQPVKDPNLPTIASYLDNIIDTILIGNKQQRLYSRFSHDVASLILYMYSI